MWRTVWPSVVVKRAIISYALQAGDHLGKTHGSCSWMIQSIGLDLKSPSASPVALNLLPGTTKTGRDGSLRRPVSRDARVNQVPIPDDPWSAARTPRVVSDEHITDHESLFKTISQSMVAIIMLQSPGNYETDLTNPPRSQYTSIVHRP